MMIDGNKIVRVRDRGKKLSPDHLAAIRAAEWRKANLSAYRSARRSQNKGTATPEQLLVIDRYELNYSPPID
jgi:hypothetical protein